MKRFLLLITSLLVSVTLSQAGPVEHVTIESPAMKGKKIDNVVVLPANYTEEQQYPVLYLLHGYGGDENGWISIRPDLPEIATRLGIIFVCPDGDRSSWYWDSPVQPEMRYETYVAHELVDYIDSHYSTRTEPAGRAITGLSMGGHGGLWLGIRHPDTFGACGSTSGGVDIRPFPDNWDMSLRLGDYDENPERWDNHTVINQLYRIKPHSLKIIIDCGTEDFFYPVNLKLHEEMLYRNIEHDFIVRPGEHNAKYWRNSILYQILFFHEFFNTDPAGRSE